MLERPTLARQLAVLALCVLAFVTRAQTVALVAAVLTAPLALAWIERGRPRRLGAYKALYGIVAGGAALVVIVELARGRSPSHVLGNYSKTSNGGYHLWPALKWLVLHVAELDLYVWILPFAALIVLVANARHLDRPLRVFAAATASLCVWLVLEVAVFASRYSLRIEERNLFYLAPLLLVALLAWIERGQPRPPRAAVVAAGLAAALPGAIPFLHLLNITAESDTLGFQPWWYVGGAWAGLSSVSIAVVLVSIALGAMFLWLPRRWAPVLPVLVALGFLATWIPLEQWKHGFPQLSKSALAQGIGRTDNELDRLRRRPQRARGGALVGRERARPRGRTSSGTAASTASTASALRCRATCRPCASERFSRRASSSVSAAGRSPTRTCSRATPSISSGRSSRAIRRSSSSSTASRRRPGSRRSSPACTRPAPV